MTVRSADLRVLTNMPKNNKAQETNNSLRLSSRDGPKVPSMGGDKVNYHQLSNLF